MTLGQFSAMDLKGAYDVEHMSSTSRIQHELWPLDGIDPKKAKFPCCLIWTPLPVVSWLAPFIGHVGICKEDGTILDFSGSNFVNVDDFSFGAAARYFQLDREQCCFPPNLTGHTCKHGYKHSEHGTAITWDDALQSSMRHFDHKTYNLFTCNCHSFVANCLNRLCYGGSMDWNMIDVAVLILFKGHWIDWKSIILPSFRSCALHRCSLGWLAFLSWPLLILSPPYGVVFVGHLLFQKPVRMLKLLQSMLIALIWGCFGNEIECSLLRRKGKCSTEMHADKHLNLLKRLIYMVNRYPIKRNVTSLMPINHEATVYSNSQASRVYYVQRTLPYSPSGRLPASHLILMTN
ncbi:LOW QUALITY PROTEIN: protein REVERSION-TO-ETHYLENE SENSITIVITY1-like [Populus alba x Populus x berolinensis]|nr:LOW QUALITY PROTEIN: protein REVERSION-TO-ETHYLENE SENSITIVITY1-like [Populus alba x Populus x berolinensis]